MIKNAIGLVCLVCLMACGGSTSEKSLDLMKYGLPIKIAAPADAEIKSDDLGFMKDVTVKDGDQYFVQILASTATELDPKKILLNKVNEVKSGPFFSKMMLEEDHGFIFEKKIDENNINYDFRYIKVQGDQEYSFQTGLIGTFTEDDVKKMYESVK